MPSSLRTVDPARDVVIIPQDVCPKFGGWIAKTIDAQIAEENAIIDMDLKCSLAINKAESGQRIAEKQRDQAVAAAEHNEAWSRWAPLGIATALVVGGIVGGVTGAAIGRR